MKTWKRGLRGAALGIVLAAATTASGVALAQAGDEGGNSASSLNLPANIQVLEHYDPHLRKATAIVNGTIITDTDVEDRLNLVLAANNNNQPISPDERDRLRLQVLRNLIDEALEIQEAKANSVTVGKDEIDQDFARVAGNFRQTPEQFTAYLRSKGASAATLKRQIEAQLAWKRLLDRKIAPFVNVGDDEVKQVIARMESQKGDKEYHVGEIFLSSTPATDAQVHANADRIMDQIRKGGSFVAYAHQYSEASTAAVGGDLGWVRAPQLPDAINTVLEQMQPGQISAPIAVPGGYSIIALEDERSVLTADPRDAILSLKQLTLSFPAGTSQDQASPRVAAFAEATQKMGGCGAAADVAARFDAQVVQNDNIKLRDLPPVLQSQMANLSIGQTTPPFGSVEDGVRVLVLCGRDDPEVSEKPSFDAIYNQMESDRVDQRAQRYLHDLRRDAIIEYR